MTNKEKYKQAFSVLHTSDISEGEVKYMAKLKKQQKKTCGGCNRSLRDRWRNRNGLRSKCRRNPANYPALDAR